MYILNKDIKEFEERIGYDKILEANAKIGKYLDFEPKVEYAVCQNGVKVYSPKEVWNFTSTDVQKSSCRAWIRENKKKAEEEGYVTTRIERYPEFHTDFNHLIECIKRLAEKTNTRYILNFPKTTFELWEFVLNDCK